jgi:hypothetical protein
MQCMSCATELLHPANFCPVCGARLAAPTPDGSTATNAAGITPAVSVVPDEPTENVRYLPTPPTQGTVPPNYHAFDYEGVTPPEQPQPASPPPTPPIPLHPSQLPPVASLAAVTNLPANTEAEGYAAEIAASLAHEPQPPLTAVGNVPTPPAPAGPTPVAPLDRQPAEVDSTLAGRSEWDPPEAFGSHGPIPMPTELVPLTPVGDNPFGDFFSDGPSAWLEDDVDDLDDDSVELTHVRVKGFLLAFVAIGMLAFAWAWVIRAMINGSGGAEAGGFVLVSMVFWIFYLSLDRSDQHHALLRVDRRVASLLDRGISPLQERTTSTLTMRRERDRYRALRDERTRRVAALGEGAYRSFRRGQLPAELAENAQRVLAMERQMMLQDHRIHELVREREAHEVGDSSDAAPAPD